MSPKQQLVATVSGEHQQAEAHGLKWMNEISEKDLILIWLEIQSMGGTPMGEIISRLAQLGFEHLLLQSKHAKE